MPTAALAAAPSVALTGAGARALLADIRTAITAAQDLLRTAWHQRIWVPLGHDSWDDFVAAELGDLRLKLPVGERRAEVATWRSEGASLRAISTALGVSVGTVAGDVRETDRTRSVGMAPGASASGAVVSLDGRRRPGTRSASTSKGVGCADTLRPVSLRVLDALAAAGADGLTLVDVSRRLKIRDGSSSGALSRLEAQGHCTRTGELRDGRSVYLSADCLG